MLFLRNLPGADKQRELPLGMPKAAEEFYQPIFSNEDIETLIWATVIDDIPANLVVRLIIASIYGARRGELTELSSDNFKLDGDKSTILIKTEKRGQRKPQPIPRSLVPLFNVGVTPLEEHILHRQLHKICKRAGVSLPKGAGYHCFRRRVVTTVSEVEHSDTVVSNFMRWAKPRTMLSRYKQTPIEQTDKAILMQHPFVKVWEQVVPYLLEFNSSYNSLLCNINYTK